ncbi:GNAT family N-acetyltransferase [Vibrio quintilis]|uniref:Ribosomal-protein-alanine N-acetyltransferase n=1 Tax=Vibrio quintilis TaxID=1117707 RepID=A0A1M7YVY4_9VIBR|nr:GNAT family N-acetyltransferase [Vibrio quintilis]SHO56761.1 ribosomal-protein-alanine N-acetyltransferase [Vibrio quintilis]
MDITLRKAQTSDIDFLILLRDATMRPYLEDVGMPTTREDYIKRIEYEFDHARIIECDGTAAGLFKAAFIHELNQWYIFQIQVHPQYQNQTIGRQLIQSLIDQARLSGADVGLSVIKTNPAQKLYVSLGFECISETNEEYNMMLKTG